MYLFSLDVDGKRADFYKCPNSMKEMVARFSDEPSDYTTIPEQVSLTLGVPMAAIANIAKQKLTNLQSPPAQITSED